MSRQPTARLSHRAWVSRGKLHVWGGCVKGQSSKFDMERHGEEVKRLTKVVEVFDVNGTREWTTVRTTGNDRPLGIRHAALALLGEDDTRAIVFGGYCGHGASCFHNSLHELDTNSWEWRLLIPDTKDRDGLAPMLKRNSGAVGFTRQGNKYVCVFAGNGVLGSSQYQKKATYATEGRKGECTTNELHCAEIIGHQAKWFWPDFTGSAPPPCADFSFVKTSDLGVIMLGGYVNSADLHDGVYHLNLENWEWSKIFSSPDVLRTCHSSTLLVPGKILTVGGADENQVTRNDMCIIDIKTGNTEMVQAEPRSCQRQWHTITAIPSNEPGTSVSVVIIGGVPATDKITDPTSWPKSETSFVMEFDLMEAQDGTEKWKLTRTTELSKIKCISWQDEEVQTDIQEVNNEKRQLADEEVQTDIQEVNDEKRQLAEVKKKLECSMEISRKKDHHIQDLKAKNECLQKRVKKLEEDCTKNAQTDRQDCSLLTFIDENLCDVETYGEELFIFKGSSAQIKSWKGYGLTIQVPQDTLSIDEQLEIAVKPIIAGRFELPEGMQLASAVYAISCSSKADKTVKLEIQHCLDVQTEDHSRSLSFVTAKLAQGDLPYKFNTVDGGVFRSKSSIGSISLSHFCLFGIGSTDSSRLQYRACAYMKKENQRRWKMTVVLFKDLDLREEYNRSFFRDEEKLVRRSFTFKDEKEPVRLALDKQQVVSGWLIGPKMYPCKVTKKEIDQSGKYDPQFVLDIFAQYGASEVLVHHVGISGINDEEPLSIAITCQQEGLMNLSSPTSGTFDCIPYTDECASPRSPLDQKCISKDFFTKIINQIPDKWMEFGFCLEIGVGDLNAIKTSHASKKECFIEVYYLWERNQTKPLTWATIVDVLEGMKEDALVNRLKQDFRL